MSNESKSVQFIKDVVSTLIIVAVIIGGGIALTGTWPFMVAVESGSMEPHMYKGDVIILVGVDRNGGVVTWEEGVKTGYMSFGNYGDVIVYKPNGYGKPIIHRAIAYVHKGEHIPALVNGKLVYTNQIAENDGYITQGDNVRTNQLPDQAVPGAFSPIGEKIKPVKKEWIIGVAKFRIPYIGYLRLLIPI
ncbi:S26 family signal peptidase [Archaeoglobus neptunius]|uniref:S26 family signal peptidase n=1 Tax=Archaeoglobus neptunius TaxID=2798580 RepID=UPI001926308A|nr:S26 family signal peptidase [Archaeoglobus neptunius]